MNLELKRIEPLRAANIMAIVYALLFVVIVLIVTPFVLLINTFEPFEDMGSGTAAWLAVAMVYPVFGAVIGWIGGLLLAVLYNLVVRWTGGLLVTVEGRPAESEA
jgi:hypothetical protein